MKTYTCEDFTGFYPIGTAAVVSARSRPEAAAQLNQELIRIGLEGNVKPESMIPFSGQGQVRILRDGNY